jgi:hypothetical protein
MDSTTLVSVGVAGIFTLAVYMCCSLPLQIQIKNASPSQIVALTKVMYTVCRIIVLDKVHSYFGFVSFKSKDNNSNNSNNNSNNINISNNSNNNSNNINNNSNNINNNSNNIKDEGKKFGKSKKPRSLLSLPPSGLGPNTTSVHPPLPPSPPSPSPPDIDSQEINSPILNKRMNLNEMQFENDLIDLGQY